MPHGNRTGPQGQGPGTGRQQGYCSGFDTPGYANSTGGGYARGMRRFMRDELAMLKTHAEELKNYQDNIQKRIIELEKQHDSDFS